MSTATNFNAGTIAKPPFDQNLALFLIRDFVSCHSTVVEIRRYPARALAQLGGLPALIEPSWMLSGRAGGVSQCILPIRAALARQKPRQV